MNRKRNPNVTIMLASACEVVAQLREKKSMRKVACDFHVTYITLNRYLEEMIGIYNENHPEDPVTRADVVKTKKSHHCNTETEKSTTEAQEDARSKSGKMTEEIKKAEETEVTFQNMKSLEKAMDDALIEAKRIKKQTEELYKNSEQLLKKIEDTLKKYDNEIQEEN